jgi:hypothetical protein
MRSVSFLALALSLWIVSPPSSAQSISGAKRVGQPVRIDLTGPVLDESSPTPGNPFLDYRGTLSITGPSGTVDVALFFAADGSAADSHATAGAIWRGYYVPPVPGSYSLRASFRKGAGVAVDPSPTGGSSAGWFDGAVANFAVGPLDPFAAGNYARGMLRYVSERYLRFDDGERFLKGGANSPENWLGYADFDNTYDLGGVATPSLAQGLHRFGPHAQHFGMYPFDTSDLWAGASRGHNLIGALNYLASAGVDSIYFLTYNTNGGDGQEVWPWIAPEADKLHFDVSKLEQWERVFRHMDRLGIQLHVVTEETENDLVLGSSLTTERKLYYRELVARFAHHNALQWNLGEESNLTASAESAFAAYLRALDPYDHPITVHTDFNAALLKYPPLYGDPSFEATSIQGNASSYHAWVLTIGADTATAGRPWAVYGDEQSPIVDSPVGDGRIANLDELRRTALWANLMGGGAGVEWYFGYQGTFGDLETEDLSLASTLWDDTRRAREFFHEYLPFDRMSPADSSTSASGDFCLALAGDTYAAYLPSGGTTSLSLAAGSYRVHWFDPRGSGSLETGSVTQVNGPGTVALGTPPHDATSDWAVLVWTCAAPTGEAALWAERPDAVTLGLRWKPVFGTLSYDVVRGDLATLRSTSGDFAAATDGCVAPAQVATAFDDPEPPPANGGFWYLVRPRSCSPGTYGSGSPGIESSGRDCP